MAVSMTIPLRIDYPPLDHDPPTRADLAAFYTVLDRWTQQVAMLLDYGVLPRLIFYNVPIPPQVAGIHVDFATPEPDTNYMIIVEMNWQGAAVGIGAKTTTGFNILFSTTTPNAPLSLSWARIR